MSLHVDIRAAGLAKLVEKQMRNWELTHAQRHKSPSPSPPEIGEFICISREVGAGGHEIALAVGDRLGWPVFSKELLHLMAGDDAFRKPIYAALDERDMGWLESMLQPLMNSNFVRDDYFRKLSETVLAIVRKGTAVFVGRAVDMILPVDAGLRVRVIAPREMRVQWFAAREKISKEQAEREIERREEERKAFIRRHFGVDVGDPKRYDLVINLGRLAHAEAAEVVVRAHELLKRRNGP
ncbi:MAG: cytidylate kinase-like family protein [Phycisphaerales bacterium]|nr:cytidylate kinase-like family protein [Phycisphaerales bacterium]